MQKAKQLPPRSLGSMKKANASRMAGIRKVLMFVMLLVSVIWHAEAQFLVENHTGCDWEVSLSVAPYSACTPLYPDVITQVVPANTNTVINLPLPYSACASCRVVSIKAYYQGAPGVYGEAGDHGVCPNYPWTAPLGECISGPNPSTLYYIGNWHAIIAK